MCVASNNEKNDIAFYTFLFHISRTLFLMYSISNDQQQIGQIKIITKQTDILFYVV